MKYYILFLVLFLAAKTCFAGISGSKHDMYAMGNGTNANTCSYCHIPHNAAGEKIWSFFGNESQLTGGPSTTIGNMCYTCHDGTIVTITTPNPEEPTFLGPDDNPFNPSRQQHKISTGSDCNMCHTVHDNTNGMFMGVPKTQSALSSYSPTYCETCHDGTPYPGAGHLPNQLTGAQHQYKFIGGSCRVCHHPHGMPFNTAPGLTNPILRGDIADSTFCDACHSTAQTTSGGMRHPALLSSPGTWGNLACRECHDIHQSEVPNRTALLDDDNTNSAFCIGCHNATDTTNGPAIGEHKHPTGVTFTTTGLTPSGADIDDDDINGVDYPSNQEKIICETCHSPHRKGVASPLLRINYNNNALCLNCHADKQIEP